MIKKQPKMTKDSIHIFRFATLAFIFELLVIVINKSSTLLVSLLRVNTIKSVRRKQGMVKAIMVSINIFIEKYTMVPSKYDLLSYPGKAIRHISLSMETVRKLPENPCIRDPI